MCDRRVTKNPRKTLNERRSDGARSAPRQAVPPRAPTNGKVRISDELVRLACLCQAGILSDDEFASVKSRLLDQYWNDPLND